MNVGCMITNGGPHPPEKWASVTASQIIDIAASAPETLLRDARAFQAKIEGLLTEHHRSVQESERTALNTAGTDHLAADMDTSYHIPDALDDLVAAAKGTSFHGHFAKPEVQDYLRRLLHEHMHHIMLIERSWHADAHPDHPLSVAFHAVAANGHALLVQSDKTLEQHGGRAAISAMVKNASSVAVIPGMGDK